MATFTYRQQLLQGLRHESFRCLITAVVEHQLSYHYGNDRINNDRISQLSGWLPSTIKKNWPPTISVSCAIQWYADVLRNVPEATGQTLNPQTMKRGLCTTVQPCLR